MKRESLVMVTKRRTFNFYSRRRKREGTSFFFYIAQPSNQPRPDATCPTGEFFLRLLFFLSVSIRAVREQKAGPSGVTVDFDVVLRASTAFAAVPWRGGKTDYRAVTGQGGIIVLLYIHTVQYISSWHSVFCTNR